MTVRVPPRRFGLAVLLLAAWALPARADDRPKPAKPDKPAAEAAPAGEKRFAFAFDNKPWIDVLDWFAEHSELAFVGNYKPAGSFTFMPPKVDGHVKSYTIGEIVDILNEALQVNSSHKRYLLIRRSQSFTLVLADDKIPKDMIPTIDVADLPRRGRSEVVRIDVRVAGADVEDLAPAIKKLMTQLGDAVPLDSPNTLVLIDTVGSLTEALKTLKVIGEGNKESAERYAHQCRYIKVRDAERVLKELFDLPPAMPPEMAVWMHRVNLERQLQQQQQHNNQGGQPRPPVRLPRPVAVAAADDSNMIIVTGPAAKVAEARQTLTELEDKAKAAGAKEQPVGPPMVKRYSVPGGDAAALAQMLQEKYRASPSVRVVNLGATELMVSAPAAEQFDIAALVSEGVGTQRVKVIPLKNGDGYFMEDTLRGIFGNRSKAPKAPYIEARTKDAITVQGSDEQIAEVEAAVKALDVPSAPSAPGGMRVISLDRGSGTAVAEELQRLLKEMGKDVKVVDPSAPAEPKKPQKPDRPPPPDTRDDKREPAKGAKLVTTPAPAEPQKPEKAGAQPLFDPRGEKKEPPREKKGGGITLIPFGGQISVKSDDPEDQRLVEQLIDLITAKTGNEEFEVVRLKHTNAAEVARLLDEMYNGPRQQHQQPQQPQPQQLLPQQQPQPQQPQGLPPVGGYGTHTPRGSASGGSGSSTGSSHYDRVRVLADPNLNALLLRAAPIDVIVIKKLVRDEIDQSAQQVIKNHVVKLKTALADEVANNIRELYRQVMDVNPLPGQRGSDRLGFQLALLGNPNAGRPVDVNGTPRTAALTVGVDERSNSLLVQSSDALFEEVKKLAEDLDEAAKNPNRRVQVRFTRGLDPALVQHVVDAIQGHRSTSPTALGGGVGGAAAAPGFNRPFGGFGGAVPAGIGTGFGGPGVLVPGGGRTPGGGGLRPDDPGSAIGSAPHGLQP